MKYCVEASEDIVEKDGTERNEGGTNMYDDYNEAIEVFATTVFALLFNMNNTNVIEYDGCCFLFEEGEREWEEITSFECGK